MVQIAGRQFRDLLCQRDGWHVRRLKEGIVVRQLAHLARRDIRQFRTPVSDVYTPQARHAIEDFVAFAVMQKDAVCPRDDTHALCGQFAACRERVHVVRCVQRLQFGRGQMVGDSRHGTLGRWSNVPRI